MVDVIWRVGDRAQWLDMAGYDVGAVILVGERGDLTVRMDEGPRTVLAPARRFRHVVDVPRGTSELRPS